MAFYLGDADYEASEKKLRAAFDIGTTEVIRSACAEILTKHPSTEERLLIIDRFYAEIFAVTGKPTVVLDLACALNPLTFPWMDLPTTVRYYAYDIHEPRISFLNSYFAFQGLPPLAKLQDIAFHPPMENGDIALFLKELPRFERNYEGATLKLLQSLCVRHVVVSFPTVSLHSGHSLDIHYSDFFLDLIHDTDWPITEIEFENELVYCAEKEW